MDGISVKGLSVRRGERVILRDLNFALPVGSITILSGLSGCGKSTLLLALQGLLDEKEAVVSGEICLDGKKIRQMADDVPYLSASGFLMQNVDAQIVNLICEDELVFGMENRGVLPEEMRRRAPAYVERYGLFPTRNVETLSGGQKQRLLLASILITGHRVLLLDEPFANLDAEGVALLLEVLEQLRAEGATILVVEHRLELIAGMADRLLWMEDGAIREYLGESISAFAAEKAKILNVGLGWNDAPGGRVIQENWLTGPVDPDTEWTQQMAFPVELSLGKTEKGYKLLHTPVPEIEKLWKKTVTVTGAVLKQGENALFKNAAGKAFDLEYEYKLP